MTSVDTANPSMLAWAGLDSNWILVDAAINAGISRMLLWGPPGTGKTNVAIQSNPRRYNMTLTEDLTVQEAIGHYIPKGTVFTWHDGPVTLAMREGATLILNELGRASGPMLDMFLGVMDDPELAEIALPTGEKIKPAKGFRVIATSNSAPETLDPALLDRFDVVIYVGTPNPQLVNRLNRETPKAKLGSIVEASYKDPARAISPRRALSFARLRSHGIDTKQSALMTFGNRAQEFYTAAVAGGSEL